MGPNPTLPQPGQTSSVRKYASIVGWPEGRTPASPPGFKVTAFASGLESPRWLYVLPNGDVLVAEAKSHPKSDRPATHRQGMVGAGSVRVSPDRITLLRDADRDGVPETRFVLLQNLNQPFGMALVGDTLFIASTDGVMRFPYKEGQTRIESPGKMILPLPAGGYNNHWTRNILASRDGRKLYVTVGSASNAGEYGLDTEIRRANILEINLDGSGERIFASGLRNPNGMAWEPTTGALWTAVNERDGLGDDLVPDYITSVRENGFYGWPYSYFGQNKDPRQGDNRPDLVARAIVPDYALGSHTASLGLAFYRGSSFPER
ncbi:MAG: sorbosone dehydrogenase family protein, partial [Beggiatoa sp.]|nr:sorbosone dehydrogenase family protein [Beggiatoa sp.]